MRVACMAFVLLILLVGCRGPSGASTPSPSDVVDASPTVSVEATSQPNANTTTPDAASPVAPNTGTPYEGASSKHLDMIGMTREDIRAQIGDLITVEEPDIYALPDKSSFLGYDCVVWLVFDRSNDQVYGVWYVMEFENDVTAAADTTSAMVNGLTDIYGAPTTYPDHPQRILGNDSLVDAIQEPFSTWREEWKMEARKTLDVNLLLRRGKEPQWRLTVQFQVPNTKVPR